MATKISTSYDWGNLPISVGEGTESNHVLNKGQVDTAISTSQAAANSYTDTTDAATRSYIDAKIVGLGEYVSAIDPANGLPVTGSGDGGAIDKNDYWTFSVDGTILGEEVHKYEKLIASVPNATVDGDFRIEHAPHTDDTRYEFTGVTVPATIQEELGSYVASVTDAFTNGDVWVVGGITITAGGNLDIATHTTATAQATAIKGLLEADNAFNTHYGIVDNLAGVLTITEKVDQATGVDLTHDESGVVGGNATFSISTNSVAYDLGDEVINHMLGYKYVQVIAAETSTDRKLETPPEFIDTNSLRLINESDTAIVVSGVCSI